MKTLRAYFAKLGTLLKLTLGILFLLIVGLSFWNFSLETTAGILVLVAIIFLFDKLAQKGIFFCYPPEGGIIAVMKGEKSVGFFGQCPGNIVDFLTGEIIPENDSRIATGAITPPPPTLLGMVWIGIYPFTTILQRHFLWQKVYFNPTRFEHRDEWTQILKWRYPYGIEIIVPTLDNVPIRAKFVVTTETVHAGHTLFGTHDFLVQTTAVVHDIVRDDMGNHTYESIIESKNGNRGSVSRSPTFNEEKLVKKIKKQVQGHILSFGQKVFSVQLLVVEVAEPENPIAKAAIDGLKRRVDARRESQVKEEQIPGEQAETILEEERKKQEILKGEGAAAVLQAKGMAEAQVKKATIEAEKDGLGASPEQMIKLRQMEEAAAAMKGWKVDSLWVQGGENGGMDPLKIINISPPGQKPTNTPPINPPPTTR